MTETTGFGHPTVTKAHVLRELSGDILEVICSQLGSPSAAAGDNVVLLKHQKNKDILTLSNVCKSWHWHLRATCKAVFQDIAFHVSSVESIATAQVFLKLLEGTRVPTHVYAELGNYQHPALLGVFAKLRSRIQHIVCFEYCGDLDGYRSYLNLPAPNLLFFSDNLDMFPGEGPPLFRGHAPKLQALTTLSPGPRPIWVTSALPNLTFLELGFLDMGTCVPLGSFLEVLRGSPHLGSISVGGFVPLLDPNDEVQDVFLPRLHTLSLQHNEFHTIVKHLKVPSVRKITYIGESHPASGGDLNPTFKALHLFYGLPLFPIFEQPIKRVSIQTRGDAELCLNLIAEGGFTLYAWLTWIDAEFLSDAYAMRSVTALAGMITLAPQAHVQLSHPYMVPSESNTPIYRPFLLLPDIHRLEIHGGFALDILDELIAHADHPLLLPNLSILDIEDQPPFVGKGGGAVLLACLQSRNDPCFSIRVANEGLPCAVYEDPRYVVNRDTNEPTFVVINFKPHELTPGI